MPSEPVPGAPPVVLTFAASDPSSGAGLQADLLTLASMGCHPLSVVTAIAVQDTTGVEGVLPMEAEWVADQARCVLEDMPVDAFKIGALGSVENIAAVAEILADYPDVPLILDPVPSIGRRDAHATEAMTQALRDLLLPQTTIATPNGHELRLLAETEDDEEPSVAECAERLDAADPLATEARGFRERMTRRLSESVEQLRITTERAQADADRFSAEIRRLTSLVGRLTARVVVQGAVQTATVRGAARPEGADLDDAISRIADDLPGAVASALWDARDELLRRALASAAPC